MLKVIGRATEDEMIATFIRAELTSPRFGDKLRLTASALGIPIDVVADDSTAASALSRRKLLEEYRGWGQYESVFGGMPDDVKWSWAQLDEPTLRERVFTIDWWFAETYGTRSVHDIGTLKRRDAHDDSRRNLERARDEVRTLEPPILLAEPHLTRLVILEGHSRILSFMAHPELVTFPILTMIGTTARISEWSEW